MFNISLTSERRQRKLAVETTSYGNLTAEMLPFAFSSGKGEPDEFREAPCVYVPNLIVTVAENLAQHLGF